MNDDEKIKKELNLIFLKGKKEDLKSFINSILDAYFRTDIIDYLKTLTYYNNCTKCVHWNYGRMYWICLKDRNIRTFAKDGVEFSTEKELIPFLDTYANEGCPDYEYRKDYINKMSLKEVKEG